MQHIITCTQSISAGVVGVHVTASLTSSAIVEVILARRHGCKARLCTPYPTHRACPSIVLGLWACDPPPPATTTRPPRPYPLSHTPDATNVMGRSAQATYPCSTPSAAFSEGLVIGTPRMQHDQKWALFQRL